MVDQEIRVLGDENIIANPKNSQKQYPLTFKAVPNVIVYGRKKADLNFTVPIAEGTNFNFNLERTAIIFSDSFNLEEYSYIMVKNPFEEISDFFYVSSLEELDPTGKEFNEFNDEVVKWLRRLVNIISNRCMIFETTLFKDLNNFPNIKTGQTFIRTEDGWTGITIRDINSELDLIFNKYVEEVNKKIKEHETKMNEHLEQWKEDIKKYAENVKQYEIVRVVTQTGHGFLFDPVMYSISQRKFVKAVFPHGADGIAVRVDDNNFRLVWAGRVEIPATARDTQQRDFVLGEYYFLGEGSNGGIQREKPDTYYQHLFQAMYSDELQQNIADVLLSVPINQKGKRWDVGEAKTTVNDIEELKMSDFPVGKVVEVLGYYKAGDGADHKRIISSTDDGSGVQLSNGKWANIVHNGEVNVSWFGAKGDGVTDDGIYLKKVFKTPNLRKVIFDKQKLNIINERNIEIPSTIKEIDFALCKISVDTSKGVPQEDWVTRNSVFSIKEQRDYTSLNTQELIELNNLNNTIYKNSITFKGIEKYGDDIVYRMFGTNDKNLEFYDCNLHMRYGTISSPFRYGINNIDRLRYRKLNKEPLVIKNLNFELTGINNQRMFCFLYITKDNVVLDNCYIDYEYNDLNNRKNLITFEDSVNVQINNLNAPQPIDNGLISEQKYDGYIVLMNDCGNVTLNNIKCRMPLHFIDNDLSSINTTCSLNIATNNTFEIYMYNSLIGKIDSHTNGYSMYFYNSILSLIQNRGGGKIELNACTLKLMHGYQREFFLCNKFDPQNNSYSKGAQICDYEIILNNCILEYSNNANQDRDHDRYCFVQIEEEKIVTGITILPTIKINNCTFDFRHIKASKILLHSYYGNTYYSQIYGGDIELYNIIILHNSSSEVIFNSMFMNDNLIESPLLEKKDGVIKAEFSNVKGLKIRPIILSNNLDFNRNFIKKIEYYCNNCTLLINEAGLGITDLEATNCIVSDFKYQDNIGNWYLINSNIEITDYYRIFRKENSKLRFDYCNFKQSSNNDYDTFCRALMSETSIAEIEFNYSVLENYKDFDISQFNKTVYDYGKFLFKRINLILQKYNSKIKHFGIYEIAMNQSEANAVTKYDYYFNVQTGSFELPQQTTNVQQLNSIYHLEKMKQENVYDDYIAYMDEKTVYDKQQRKLEQNRQFAYEEALKENPELTYEEFMSVQPMTLNFVEEPQPSDALKKFMDKYL